jgi:transglutaminase/protease-like cytokinesis protein 3
MKFLSLSKSSAEISRLTAELAAATAENSKLKASQEVADKSDLDELAKANEEVCAALTKAQADLVAANGAIASLTATRDAAVSAQAAAVEAQKDFDAKLEKRANELAAIKAAEITAKLGQAPIPEAKDKTENKGRDRFLAAFKIS